ncbi:MAG TPA: ComEC/Rec2 family competence protein, partial [candidate division Zixibacteria bacterium]|nr:ComEC/Rec2 family competence protein [candidate division Zixibacteria bacterium]
MFRKYPSLCLLAGVTAGILLADTLRIPAWVFMIFCLVLGSVAMLTLAARRRLLFAVLCIGTFCCFAALRFALSYYDLSANNVIQYADGSHSYRLFGTVSDWPRLKPELTEIRLDLDSLVTQRSLLVRGTVLLRITDTTTAIQRGDRIECYGRIYPVKSGRSGSTFDYQRFLRLKGISGTVYLPTLLDVRIDRRNRYSFFAFIDRLRSTIRSSFYRNLTPEAAALATGFLIGETRDIPVDLYQRFRESGTLHLLAVSGSNVALILVSVVALLRPFRIRRKPRALLLMAIVVVFSFLSYGEPSVLRAAVMAGLVLGASVLERKYDLNNVIALAALIILLADPSQLFDVGFQLSFVIAWGLIFILPKVTALLSAHRNKRWYRYLVFPLLVSLTAQVCATGLIGLYFQQVPVLSPAANLIVVPLVSVVVVGSLILLLADLVLPILGLMVGSWLNV